VEGKGFGGGPVDVPEPPTRPKGREWLG